MQIDKHKVVTIDYTLKDDAGNLIDQSEGGAFAYLHGEGNIIPGLETALVGKSSGEEVTVSISPEEGYGVRDDDKTQAVPREMFSSEAEIEAGMQFHAEGPEGQTLVVTVVEVGENEVTVDGNHPLAGVHLNFEVKVIDVREATAEEISHGHVHGPGGQVHH